jgi:hypothetical protein
MNRLTFYFVITLSLIFSVATLGEAWLYESYENTVAQQQDIQAHLANSQRLNAFTEQLLRRLAVDSQHDPGLAELLEKHKVKVIISDQQPGMPPRPEAAPDDVTASMPADKTVSTPINPPARHP